MLCKLGARIRAIRKGHELTQLQFAEKLDLSTPYLANLETGKATPSLAVLEAIAKMFHLPLFELLHFPDVEHLSEPEQKDVILFLNQLAHKAKDISKEQREALLYLADVFRKKK